LPEEIEETCMIGFIPVTRSFPIYKRMYDNFYFLGKRIVRKHNADTKEQYKQYRFSSIDIPENCYAVLNQIISRLAYDFGTINNNYFNNLIDGNISTFRKR